MFVRGVPVFPLEVMRPLSVSRPIFPRFAPLSCRLWLHPSRRAEYPTMGRVDHTDWVAVTKAKRNRFGSSSRLIARRSIFLPLVFKNEGFSYNGVRRRCLEPIRP